jgi:NitT/TauT family transport system ATP-binding protein
MDDPVPTIGAGLAVNGNAGRHGHRIVPTSEVGDAIVPAAAEGEAIWEVTSQLVDPGDAKIAVRQVERVFATKRDRVQALGPMDLDVGDGEFVCLVGPSGCGKSTLLRIVAGLVNPTAGEVQISPGGTGKVPVAMVFQDYSIYPWKSVLANVRFGLDLAHVPRKEATASAMKWIDKLGLTDFADAFPNTLSGGMRQRVSIARALAVEPEVLLMDEPFAALDAMLRMVLQDELLDLWQSDRRTVLFVTHSLEEAILLGDRVVVMSARPGRILADFKIPFDRPRRPELRADPGFTALQGRLWEELSGEVS